jgi:hypothetical protein
MRAYKYTYIRLYTYIGIHTYVQLDQDTLFLREHNIHTYTYIQLGRNTLAIRAHHTHIHTYMYTYSLAERRFSFSNTILWITQSYSHTYIYTYIQLDRDTLFLREHDLMDYSLFVGVHLCRLTTEPTEPDESAGGVTVTSGI